MPDVVVVVDGVVVGPPRVAQRADRLGRTLAGLDLSIDAILTSPKARASETADIVAGHLGMAVENWPPDNIEDLAKKYEDQI